MEEKKKREWVKNAIIVFLVVMLILTLCSNTIVNYSLPEVSAQYCYSGQITNKVRGSGIVEAADPYAVTVKETRKIDSVSVRVGDHVEKGDTIYILEDGESEELAEAIKTLESLKLDYEKAVITGGIESSVTNAVENGTAGDMSTNQAKMEKAKNNVEAWKKKVDALSKQQTEFSAGTATYVAEKKALKDAQDNLEAWTKQNASDSISVSDYSVKYESSKATVKDLEKQVKDMTERFNDVSAGEITPNPGESLDDIAQDIKDLKKELAAAQTEYEGNKKAYETAVANESTSAEMIKYYEQAVKNAEQTLEDKTYQISVDLANAQESLAKAEEDYSELLETLSAQYGLEAQISAIKDQEAIVNKLKESSVGGAVTAPVAGTILTLAFMAGETIETGSEVATIQREGKNFTLTMEVTNDQARYLNIGDEAEVSNSWWYSDVHARIIKITVNRDNPQSGKLVIFELEGDLTGGQSLSLSVGNKTANYDTIVPSSAIREDNNGKFVLGIETKNTPLGNRYIAKRIDVTVLAESDKETAVSGDFSTWGEYIITTSSAPVEAGKQVRLKEF